MASRLRTVNSLMTNRKNIFLLRLINTLLFIALFLIQYNGAFTISIARANPMLPLALLVTVCMFSSELTSAVSGLLLGVFVDTVASTPPGFNAMIFMIIAVAASLIIKHLFNNNIWAGVALCALCSAFYYLVRWLFCIAFTATITDNLTYIMEIVFPSVLYTALFAIPFYYIEKKLYNKFYK